VRSEGRQKVVLLLFHTSGGTVDYLIVFCGYNMVGRKEGGAVLDGRRVDVNW